MWYTLFMTRFERGFKSVGKQHSTCFACPGIVLRPSENPDEHPPAKVSAQLLKVPVVSVIHEEMIGHNGQTLYMVPEVVSCPRLRSPKGTCGAIEEAPDLQKRSGFKKVECPYNEPTIHSHYWNNKRM